MTTERKKQQKKAPELNKGTGTILQTENKVYLNIPFYIRRPDSDIGKTYRNMGRYSFFQLSEILKYKGIMRSQFYSEFAGLFLRIQDLSIFYRILLSSIYKETIKELDSILEDIQSNPDIPQKYKDKIKQDTILFGSYINLVFIDFSLMDFMIWYHHQISYLGTRY